MIDQTQAPAIDSLDDAILSLLNPRQGRATAWIAFQLFTVTRSEHGIRDVRNRLRRLELAGKVLGMRRGKRGPLRWFLLARLPDAD